MTRFSLVLALLVAAGAAAADSHEAGETAMEGMDHSAMGHGDMAAMPAHMQGMMGAMDTMMGAMPMESTGDPDADFLLMMIPHHQSAVDMARLVLEEGDDEETRTLSELRGRGAPFDLLPEEPAVAVNRTYAFLDEELSAGDEVAFIPPVAGG